MDKPTLDTFPLRYRTRLTPLPTGEVLAEVRFPMGKGGGVTVRPPRQEVNDAQL